MSDRRTEENEPEPLVVKPKVAWKMLSCSNTHGYELLEAGELESYKDGRSRKITIASIKAHIARRLVGGGR
jgi:excisionase family DNA binding protein